MGEQEYPWGSRGHFFAAAAEAMRRILIDRARAKKRVKRGGGRKRLDLNSADVTIDVVPDEILDLDAALTKLNQPGRWTVDDLPHAMRLAR